MPGGRPTLLTADLIERAKGYLITCVDYKDEFNRIRTRVPTIERFAIWLDVSRESIYEWEKDESDLGKQFSYILEQVRKEQAARLIEGGLDGSYNSTISALVLGKHGYVKEQHQDMTTNGQPMFLPSELISKNAINTSDKQSN